MQTSTGGIEQENRTASERPTSGRVYLFCQSGNSKKTAGIESIPKEMRQQPQYYNFFACFLFQVVIFPDDVHDSRAGRIREFAHSLVCYLEESGEEKKLPDGMGMAITIIIFTDGDCWLMMKIQFLSSGLIAIKGAIRGSWWRRRGCPFLAYCSSGRTKEQPKESFALIFVVPKEGMF